MMKSLLRKEYGLCGISVTYMFMILTGLMTMIPNYPILIATSIFGIGIVTSFQEAREGHDFAYMSTLPICKKDMVRAKFAFVLSIQAINFLIVLAVVIFRLLFLADAQVYVKNTLMNGNVTYLGYVLLCYAIFNFCFLAEFFKTGYYFARPNIKYFAVSTPVVIVLEILHHIPGFKMLNYTRPTAVQFIILGGGAVVYAVITALAYSLSVKRFERVNL